MDFTVAPFVWSKENIATAAIYTFSPLLPLREVVLTLSTSTGASKLAVQKDWGFW